MMRAHTIASGLKLFVALFVFAISTVARPTLVLARDCQTLFRSANTAAYFENVLSRANAKDSSVGMSHQVSRFEMKTDELAWRANDTSTLEWLVHYASTDVVSEATRILSEYGYSAQAVAIAEAPRGNQSTFKDPPFAMKTVSSRMLGGKRKLDPFSVDGMFISFLKSKLPEWTTANYEAGEKGPEQSAIWMDNLLEVKGEIAGISYAKADRPIYVVELKPAAALASGQSLPPAPEGMIWKVTGVDSQHQKLTVELTEESH